MEYQKLKLKLKGLAPLLLHNSRTSDPADYYAKEMKKISSKRNKTPADHEELAKLEFFAGLYTNEDKKVVIPTRVLYGVAINGAKKMKLGQVAKAGLFIGKDAILEFQDKNTSVEELYNNKKYVYKTPVVVQRNRIIRTRPIFNDWSIEIEVEYLPDVISKDDVKEIFEKAGILVGIGDWRPQYGRFEVEVLN